MWLTTSNNHGVSQLAEFLVRQSACELLPTIHAEPSLYIATIITERNLIALEVLREQLAKGKKRIGIFYGAGHLGDMSRRLVSDFGMKFTGEKWVEAWDLRSKPRRPNRK